MYANDQQKRAGRYAALLFLLASPLAAQEGASDAEDADELEQIVITGTRVYNGDLPGSGTLLTEEHIRLQAHQDINRLLRSVPGVQVREEDGYGLRPNISMRAAAGDRSANVTVMEDGVLIAPAPYSAPSAYYFPRLSRMRSVEVVKGPSAVEYGPFTTGGSINMLSSQPTSESGGWVRARLGSENSRDLWVGGNYVQGQVQAMAEVLDEHSDGFKELDTGGDTGFAIRGQLARFTWNSPSFNSVRHRLEAKVEDSKERSDVTYMGLTRQDYESTPYRRYTGSQKDRFVGDHAQFWLRYSGQVDTGGSLGLGWTVTSYSTEYARNWYKVERVGGSSLSRVLANPADYADQLAVLRGGDSSDACIAAPSAETCAASNLSLRANNREYEASGVQGAAVIGIGDDSSTVRHELEIGMRLHEDSVNRLQWWDQYLSQDRVLQRYEAGIPGTQANRMQQADVTALYMTDRLHLGEKLVVNLGLRNESISGQRLDWSTSDPARREAPRQRSADISLNSYGLGTVWQFRPQLAALASWHRGSSPASIYQQQTEEADNLELGVRLSDRGVFSGELIYFVSDYSNLTGTCTVSSGCSGEVGDAFSAGGARAAGLELTMMARPKWGRYDIPVRFVWTQTSTEFMQSFQSDYDIWGTVNSGDEFAYLPASRMHLDIGVRLQEIWSLNLSLLAQGEQRTTAGSGDIPAHQRIPAHNVLDLNARWQVMRRQGTLEHLEVLLSVRNLLDEAYLVSAHPAGVRPGLSQAFSVGIRAEF